MIARVFVKSGAIVAVCTGDVCANVEHDEIHEFPAVRAMKASDFTMIDGVPQLDADAPPQRFKIQPDEVTT